jgi:hypothetical protein
VLAILVFTQQNAQSKVGADRWILGNKAWPSVNGAGLGAVEGIRWFSGFGVSTMALDYQDEEPLELGIAGTISLINDRLLFGYGANLQANETRGFWFFAFRLFGTPGLANKTR